MNYHRFIIHNYKAVKDSSISVIQEPVPIIGINESGKSSVLEAIAHFDLRNDAIADERKWKFQNRYLTRETDFSVEAEVEYVDDELDLIMSGFTEEEKTQIRDILSQAPRAGYLSITRTFKKVSGQTVRSYLLMQNTGELIDRFTQLAVSALPRLVYFDNFLENPFPDEVVFPVEYAQDPSTVLGEYQSMVEVMFERAGYSLQEYLADTDSYTRGTTLRQVSDLVTREVIHDWNGMHFEPDEVDEGSKVSISLSVGSTPQTINIDVEEEFKDEQGQRATAILPLSDRSLGFRWFFNFSARRCFGSKEKGKLVYLIDEPGSHLHNSAQEVLAQSIVSLAKENSVIFSTHSEFLLNPDIININNIKVIEKRDRRIKLVPYAQTRDTKLNGALSPLYNALRTRLPLATVLNQKVVVTEGITDYYFWKMLVGSEIIFLPGFGAGQNRYLLSSAIGSASKYLALFDGDKEGSMAIEGYKVVFGEDEAVNWKQYTNKDGKAVKLEKLISEQDKKRLGKLVGTTDLKKAMTLLFFSTEQKNFWKQIDDDTKANLIASTTLIKSHLGITGSLKYGL